MGGIFVKEMMCVCPKCGDTGFGFTRGMCDACKIKVIETETTVDEFMEMSAVEEQQWRREITEKYVKTNPLFDEKAQDKRLTEELKENYEAKHQIKCPTCQSTSVRRISTTEKVVNIGLFGLFGNKRKQQFECGHCGYRW